MMSRRVSRRVILGLLALAGIVALPWLHPGSVFLSLVERPYSQSVQDVRPPWEADGVIVLGGGFDSIAGPDGTVQSVNPRIDAAAALLKANPRLTAVLAGGGIIEWTNVLEADMAEQMLRTQHEVRNPILKEDQSTTTYENALYSKTLTAGRRWLLVTSPSHMTRALGTFRSLGVCVWPAPSNGEPPAGFSGGVDLEQDKRNFRLALHEVMGIVVYSLRGRFSLSSPCAATVPPVPVLQGPMRPQRRAAEGLAT